MTTEQFEECLRLRKAGWTIRMAARAVGVPEGSLGSRLAKTGNRFGQPAARRKLTEEMVVAAIARHDKGESWDNIALGYAVGRGTLMHRVYALDERQMDARRGQPTLGAYNCAVYEPHIPRKIRAVIKPPDQVNALARQFIDGKITAAELGFMIGAGA